MGAASEPLLPPRSIRVLGFGPQPSGVGYACFDLPCSGTYAKGALGTLTFRMADGACVMDLHATLFAISDAAELSTARMDAEGIPMPGVLGGGSCPKP